VRLRLGVEADFGHQSLWKPHDLPPYVALGDLTDQLAVLLGETGRAKLLKGDSDFVQPLNFDFGDGLAAGKRQQLGGEIDGVERGLLSVLLPVVIHDDLHAIRAKEVAEESELLEHDAGGDGGSDGGDQLSPTRVDGGLLAPREDSTAGGLVPLADALAIGIDIIPQSLRKVVPGGAGKARGIGRFGQRDVRPAGDPSDAGIPVPD
jgi:hypothetical protein